MTWEIFGQASRALAQMVAEDGYDPDMILSIARGGLLIGGALGYSLAVKNVYTMNVEFYTGVDERLEVPRILPPAPDFVDLGDAKILIADEEPELQQAATPDHTYRCFYPVGSPEYLERKVELTRKGELVSTGEVS